MAVVAVLMQHDPLVAFIPNVPNSAQYSYYTIDHKLLSIVHACKRWHPYLDGKMTVKLIDPKPLNPHSINIHTAPDLNKR